MKYKVGDKVKIVGNKETLISKRTFIGKIATIQKVYEGKRFCPYLLDCSCTWNWGEDELAPMSNEKIVITTDGTETLARRYVDGKVIDRAVAKCSPDDKFDFLIGAMLAFDRLVEEKKPEEPKYYSGKVVCVSAKGEGFTIGKIYKFIDGLIIDNDGMERPVCERITSLDCEYMKNWLYGFIPLVED